MVVHMPEWVRAFADVKPDKALALKPLEEAAEVFGAWQTWQRFACDPAMVGYVIDEIADCVQMLANLASAMGCDDLSSALLECQQRNEKRGRYE